MGVDQDDRRAFLLERRASSAERFTAALSKNYDADWGEISSSHARMLARFLAHLDVAGASGQAGSARLAVLDAACGTGKYWPTLLGAGCALTGVDHSSGMLQQAAAKFGDVPTRLLALQDLGSAADLRSRFDALICVDALEYVGPEDWPGVVRGLAATLRPGGLAYVTVEQPEGPITAPVDPRQVEGEDFDGIGYHYYPGRDDVLRWLSGGGFTVLEDCDGDFYWHLLLREGARG